MNLLPEGHHKISIKLIECSGQKSQQKSVNRNLD